LFTDRRSITTQSYIQAQKKKNNTLGVHTTSLIAHEHFSPTIKLLYFVLAAYVLVLNGYKFK
jgi:hypothetical protein